MEGYVSRAPRGRLEAVESVVESGCSGGRVSGVRVGEMLVALGTVVLLPFDRFCPMMRP